MEVPPIRYDCDQEGCGKSYIRPFNLHRHQQNHTPEQIYRCDFPDCVRTFVRQDLYNTHRNRHAAKETQLRRKDTISGHGSQVPETQIPLHGSDSPEVINIKSLTSQIQCQSPQEVNPNSYLLATNPSSGTDLGTDSSERSHPTSDYPSESLHHQQSGPKMALLEQMTASNTMPVFGGEGYDESTLAIPQDFVAYLFGEHNPFSMSQMGQQSYGNYTGAQTQYYAPYVANDMNLGGFFPTCQQPVNHPMTVASLPETVLSEEKSQAIIDLIKERFNETDHAPVARQREALLEGDRSDNSHMMSRKMIQRYIGSYWHHFSDQIPILHKPTFSPDKTPNLLLIAMMAIGASFLNKIHCYEKAQAGAELSNFLAWHLRLEIFRNHAQPPAELWVFQALLLLELYEKMYSTRLLHERGHIHHTTTITLMHRGSGLIRRPALYSSLSAGAITPDEWWDHWITNEATRRTAFSAFVIDSIHSTMFGHSTVMETHEMRLLPLPCDEALWSATNSAEVRRIEARLNADGVKPTTFLEGLKRTVDGQEVRTSSFGRTILMAGLLNLSWHMNERDLQVNSLGVSHVLGEQYKRRRSFTRAFDLWKYDFERSLDGTADGISRPYVYAEKKEDNVVFQSGTVLHHLAHMATHADIADCQIVAGAERLLGRDIGSQDLNSSRRRMDHWTRTAEARDATWYALRFLCSVLLPEESVTSAIHTDHGDPSFHYSARDDVVLNRPWVMYFAALIVWCYGYTLEGHTTSPVPAANDFGGQVRDMRAYLRRLGGVQSPEGLKSMRGFNGCSGMLMVLRAVFRNTRWELLHEAAHLLKNCIQLIGGQASDG
ncbi:related to C2H2 zinc finger protein [Phialocephala subalpina]|uniref:Related to C2H2 zinc finger protein n=1 Tax=Phialocephala subalpina TaxID=576137 RepID=A0A1L7XIM5_9HELO|nr:related to C2H2 zinc finger protein [Phialocephala subalpina]